MATRQIKDAKDLTTNELIYFKGHAKATYMSDGRTVEDAVNETAKIYITPFTVEEFCSGYVELNDEQYNGLINAASQNRIIGMPYTSYSTGHIVANYKYGFNELDSWLILEVIYNNSHYSNTITSSSHSFLRGGSHCSPLQPLSYEVIVEDGVANVGDDVFYSDNCIFVVSGECTELFILLEPSEIGKTVRFVTGESCTLEFAWPVCWANGEIPTIEPYTYYELSLVANMNGELNAVLTPFKSVEP